YQGLLETWNDREIEAGSEWEIEINENLQNADIILLLISSDFIASYYSWHHEISVALERDRIGEVRVIPIIVRDVNWSTAPFAKLQFLPENGLPVTNWPNRDSAWRNVSEGIEKIIEEIRKKKAEGFNPQLMKLLKKARHTRRKLKPSIS